MRGVYEEYPVNNDIGIKRQDGCDAGNACADAHGWQCWTKANGKKTCQRHGIPTRKELDEWKVNVAWIFDIGVTDLTGRLCFVAEICHTHPMNDAKIAWLKQQQIPWIELNATWVLNCVKSPFDLSKGILRSSLGKSGGEEKEVQ